MSDNLLLNGYVGSKARHAEKIKSLFDRKCKKYIEPFAGSAAVFFSFYNSKYEKELLNDANPNIAILYRALSDVDMREETYHKILELEKNDNEQIARDNFKEARRNMFPDRIRIEKKWMDNKENRSKMIEIAVNTYLVYSQSFNCNGKNYSARKNAIKYKMEKERNVKNAMSRLVKPSDELKITCLDGMQIIKRKKEFEDIQMFIDWPYTGIYRDCNKLYQTEMAGLQAHVDGAKEMSEAKAAIVMCDYRAKQEGVPTIYDAILGEDWHCFKLADTYKKCEVLKHGDKRKKAEEFMWTNRVPENAKYYLSMKDYKENITLDEYWYKIRKAMEQKVICETKEIGEYCAVYSNMHEGNSLL